MHDIHDLDHAARTERAAARSRLLERQLAEARDTESSLYRQRIAELQADVARERARFAELADAYARVRARIDLPYASAAACGPELFAQTEAVLDAALARADGDADVPDPVLAACAA